MRIADSARLAGFFGALAVKEHIAPNLRVRPRVAELFLTENCNLRCVSCACWRTTTRDELSTAEWRDVLRQLREMKFLKVNFTGGEPLVRRDAVELISLARDLDIDQIHLNTNAVLLTADKRAELLAAGVRSFNVSVDGPSALVHDRIRGRLGAFRTTMDALEGLIADRERYGLKLRMNFTIMRDNIQHLPEMARLAQRTQVQLYLNLATDTTFLFRDPQVTEQAAIDREAIGAALAEVEAIAREDPRWLPRYSDLNYIPGHFSDLVQRDLPCAESQLKFMVHSRGEVGGCWGEDPPFNVRERSIREILDTPEFWRDQARLFRKDCVGCGSNYSLNLRWRPSTYVEDRRWRRGRRSLADL